MMTNDMLHNIRWRFIEWLHRDDYNELENFIRGMDRIRWVNK